MINYAIFRSEYEHKNDLLITILVYEKFFMKNWLKKQSTLNSNNLKAIGFAFLWAAGSTFALGIIGIKIPAIGIVIWIVMAYEYRKKFNKLRKA